MSGMRAHLQVVAPFREAVADIGGADAVARLSRWLNEHVRDGGGPVGLSRIGKGSSNELYEVRWSARTWVLRRPQRIPQDAAASNRIMSREYRVLRALAGTGVPHPEPVALCEDPGVIGAHFYLMERVEGFSPVGLFPPPFDADPAARRHWGLVIADVLAALGAVDWRAAGLEDFGRPAGFLDRQVDRWLSHLAAHRTRDIPGLQETAGWLRENVPASPQAGLMHGDYQPHNLLFAAELPARLTAVLDWEQATIGDPLLDLGLLLAGWADPGEPPRFASYMSPRDGLPTRAELLARYQQRSGRDVSSIAFYEVLAIFKLACVLEGNYRLWVTGRSSQEVHRRTGDIVLGLARQAQAACRGAAG